VIGSEGGGKLDEGLDFKLVWRKADQALDRMEEFILGKSRNFAAMLEDGLLVMLHF